MHDPIVSIEMIEKKAFDAFHRGETISDDPFPPNSPASQTWRETFGKLERMFGGKAVSAHGIA